jgi:tetraacyldisaccharide 4'-kinase
MKPRPSQVLLLPFSLLYGAGAALRNRFYDLGWLRSFGFDLPVIVVGNLQAGGTGKTPCVEYLLRLLSPDYKLAVLSRGYGRNTRGYLLAGPQATAQDIGDEPLLLKRLHPWLEVAVSELRVPAIPALLTDAPELQVVLCDDAFQHRPLRGGFNLLLTGYDLLYIDDVMLPAGRLREPVSGARRAQALLVTGCPPDLPQERLGELTQRLQAYPEQPVFFAGSAYGQPYRFGQPDLFWQEPSGEGPLRVLLLTGIARSLRVRQALESGAVASGTGTLRPKLLLRHLDYPDHHRWQPRDLERLRRVYAREAASGPCLILTTEKDAVRLEAHADALADLPLYVLPQRMALLPDSRAPFDALIRGYVQGAIAAGAPEESDASDAG